LTRSAKQPAKAISTPAIADAIIAAKGYGKTGNRLTKWRLSAQEKQP
jgi:hypothetical protein